MNTEDATVETTPLEMTDFFTLIRHWNGGLKATTMRQYETGSKLVLSVPNCPKRRQYDPMDRVEMPKLPKDREIKYLHHKEVKELLKAVPHDRHAGIRGHRKGPRQRRQNPDCVL